MSGDTLHDVNAAYGAQQDTPTLLSRALRTVWRVMIERFWTFAGVVLGVFFLAAAAVMMMTPQYVAQAALKIDPTNVVSDLQTDNRYAPPDRAKIESEIKVIQSRDLSRQVVRKLGLANDPEFGGEAGQPSDAQVDAVAATVLGNLEVSLQPNSYIVYVNFASVDATKAARIANAFAEAYVQENVGSRTGTAGVAADWLTQQRQSKETEVRDADAKVAQYKAEAGLVEGGANGTITDQQIGPIAAQLAQAESAAADTRARLASAQQQIRAGNVEAVANVLSSPVVTALRSQRGQLIQNRDDIMARYGPKHPDTIRVNQQLQSLDEQILQEARRLTTAMESNARSAEAQAGSLRSTLNRLRSEQASNTRAAVVANQLERDAATKRTAFEQLAKAEQDAETAAHNSMTNVRIIESARAPDSPAKPRRGLLLAIAFLAGLSGGATVITLQEVLARGIRSLDDLERKLGIRMIAALPRLSKHDGAAANPCDYVIDRPMSLYSEGLRNLRSALLVSTGAGDRLPASIAIVSSLPSEGKTSVSLGLARVMALAGDRVAIVDGDFRRAGISNATGYNSEITLMEVLRDGADPALAIKPDKVSGVDLLTINEPTFSPEDYFGGAALDQLLTNLSKSYDTVIIDTPPYLAVADARTIVSHAASVVLVAAWDQTPLDAVEKTVQQLEIAKAPFAGAVVTMVDPNAELMGTNYYSKKYAAYYLE